MGPVVHWQQKCFRGVQSYHSLESAKEEEKKTQDSMERMSRRDSEACEKIKAAVRVTISHLQLQRVSSLSFSAGSGTRSLSPLLKLVQISWICRDTGQHCVHFSFGLVCSFCLLNDFVLCVSTPWNFVLSSFCSLCSFLPRVRGGSSVHLRFRGCGHCSVLLLSSW